MLPHDVFCGGTAEAIESRPLLANSTRTVQTPTCEQVAASTRRSAGTHAEWHEACTALSMYQLAVSQRLVRRIPRQERGRSFCMDSSTEPVGSGRHWQEYDPASPMFSIDSRLGVSRILTYAGWTLSGPSFASTGRPGYGGGFCPQIKPRPRGADWMGVTNHMHRGSNSEG